MQTDPILTSYPPQVLEQLDRLTQLIVKAEPACSILLLGSTARGELSLRQSSSDTWELFSDYEVAMITNKRLSREQRSKLAEQVHQLESQISNPNPLFHIDLLIRERYRLRTLPRIIFTYEMRENGLTLYGPDVHQNVPKVTPENLDYWNTHEILYKRLGAIAFHLPRRWIHGTASASELRVAGYLLCRNALDLTTVFLPAEGILLPTYQARVGHIRDHYNTLNIATTFGPAFPSFLETCLQRRKNLDFCQTEMTSLYTATLDYLTRGLTALFPLDVTQLDQIPHYSRRVYHEWPISPREWHNLVQLVTRVMTTNGASEAIEWLKRAKKGWLTLGLWSMLGSLSSWFAGQPVSAYHALEQSKLALEMLVTRSMPQLPGAFPERWLTLRLAWAGFWQRYIRLSANEYQKRMRSVMEWTRE